MQIFFKAGLLLLFLSYVKVIAKKFPKPCTVLQPIYLLGQAVPDRYRLPRGVNLVYDDEGYVHAFTFETQAKTLRFPASKIMTRCDIFPEEYSVLVTIKLDLRALVLEEYIFAIIPENSVEVQLGLRISRGRIIFEYSDHRTPTGRTKSAMFRNMRIFDGHWHTFVITVAGRTIGFKVDCGKQRTQRLRRDFPSLVNTSNSNIHVANGKTLTEQFSGLLKQLILLPGADASRLSCPSLTPTLPDISRGWERETPELDNRIPQGPSSRYSAYSCTWTETGKVVYDINTNAVRACVSGVWHPVGGLGAPGSFAEQKLPAKLDYFVHHQDITTPTPAIDVEIFTIPDEGLFMVMAMYDSKVSAKQPSTVYKWQKRKFVQYQNLTTVGAQSWEHFQIGKQFFIAVANFGLSREKSSKSVIYRWSRRHKKFKVQQELVTYTARDIEYFRIGDNHFIAVANHAQGDNNQIDSVIYKWDKELRSFEKFQAISTEAAYDWTHFVVNGYHFLVVANAFNGVTTRVDSVVYFYQENRFVFFQTIETTGATDWEVIQIEKSLYLAVANAYNYGPQNRENEKEPYKTNSTIYKLNVAKRQFEKYQIIETQGAVDWETFRIGNDTFLAVSNAQNDESKPSNKRKSVIYRWQGVEKFVPVHYLETRPCTDWEMFEVDGENYLIYSNWKDTTSEVYRAKLLTD